MSNQSTIVIGTIGHVAHGKSTIVRSISGVQTVRFKEERERNITIKLGYANAKVFECPRCPRPGCYQAYGSNRRNKSDCRFCGSTLRLVRHVSFLDCPGHEFYMAEMLNGLSVMDAALLIIACNERFPQPQTSQHLAAAVALKIPYTIILQNKVDLMDERTVKQHYNDIRHFTDRMLEREKERPLIIPISAQLNYNIDVVNEYLVTQIPPPARDFQASPQMTIIRSFDINRPGTLLQYIRGGIVGGSIIKGILKTSQEIEIRPGIILKASPDHIVCYSVFSKIVSLFAEKNLLSFAVPGGLIAVGTIFEPGLSRANALAGHRLGKIGRLPAVVIRIEICFFLFRRLLGIKSRQEHKANRVSPLLVGERIQINVGSMRALARVENILDQEKKSKLSLDKPICCEIGEKLAISRLITSSTNERSQKNWRMIGWGNISKQLDAHV